LKKLLIGLIVLVFLAGCSGGEVNDLNSENSVAHVELNAFDEILLKDASRYLMFPDSPTPNLKNNIVDFLLKNKDNSSDPEKIEQLARLIDADEYEAATELYLELGGEPLSPPKESEFGKEVREMNERNDKNFGIQALHSANLFLSADFTITDEDRRATAELVNGSRMWISEENRKHFDKLAELIANNEVDAAKKVFNELKDKYIPEDKVDLFNKLGEANSADELGEWLDEISK